MSELETTTLPSGIVLPKGYLSISQIDTYMRCGLQYFWRYIDGIIIPPTISLVTGSSGHDALEMNFKYKGANRTDAPLEDVLDVFNDSFEEKFAEVEDPTPVSKGNAKDKTVDLITLHHEKMAPAIQPVDEHHVEKKIITDVGGIPMHGFSDVETSTAIIDHKFVGRAKSAADADSSLQLTFYAYAEGKPDVAFNCLVKPKLNKGGTWSPPSVKMVPGARRTQEDFNWLTSVVRFTANAISAGIFMPADPTSWVCSKTYCGYWHKCRGAGKDIAPIIVGVNGFKDTKPAPAPKPKCAPKDAPVFQLEV
jgi:hypothetical protein